MRLIWKITLLAQKKGKVTKILDIPTPDTKKKVKQFVGAVSYFSNMIENLQVLLGPLHAVASPKPGFVGMKIAKLLLKQ